MMNNEFASFRVVDKAERRALQLPDLGKVVSLQWDENEMTKNNDKIDKMTKIVKHNYENARK